MLDVEEFYRAVDVQYEFYSSGYNIKVMI